MKVLILCGGMGTRLREETEFKPKPMVEIGGKPILWHIMKIYSHYGFNEFVLALGYKGSYIRDYFLNYKYYNSDFTIDIGKESVKVFHDGVKEDWKVTLVDTGDEAMTGFRLKLCEKYVDGDTFMLTYGDAVSDVNLTRLLEYHKEQKTIATVSGVYPSSRFGDLEVSGNLVTNFKEKLIDLNSKNPINGGFFVFNKRIFDYIDNNPLCDLEKQPMSKLTKENQLSFYDHKGYWQCMDTYRDFINLNNEWKSNPKWKIWE
jgi:glucose-1-phosphate cytidylyltransferase